MSLEQVVKELANELGSAELMEPIEQGYRLFFSDGVVVDVSQHSSEKILFKCPVISPPGSDALPLFRKVMTANLFGRGNRGAIVGLSHDEKMLTLSCELEYNCSYKEFKEKLEDIVTTIDYWRGLSDVSA